MRNYRGRALRVFGERAPLRADMAGGEASDARTAEGDTPVFAYIDSLPQPQRGIAKQIDALAGTLPGLRRGARGRR